MAILRKRTGSKLRFSSVTYLLGVTGVKSLLASSSGRHLDKGAGECVASKHSWVFYDLGAIVTRPILVSVIGGSPSMLKTQLVATLVASD